jgi:hypothetical protein
MRKWGFCDTADLDSRRRVARRVALANLHEVVINWLDETLGFLQHALVPGSGRIARETPMGLFDNLEAKAAEIAKKTGVAAADVHAIANTFQANLTSSDGNPEEAIEAAAAQHGVDTATVREIISRAGGLETEIGDIAEHSVKPGGI